MIYLNPDLRLIVAPNPGPMTGAGTNTYLLGNGNVVLIDPGPALPAHLDAVLGALAPGERLAAILITHSHLDHTALTRALAAATGAPVYGAPPAGSGRSAAMAARAARGLSGGGEGFDLSYAPDRILRDGETLRIGDQVIEVLATPGHTGCHLSYACQGRLFSGDTVMGWSTSLISPPDGDMANYLASLQALVIRDWQVIHPGHGPAIRNPADRLAELIAHRKSREAEILTALANLGPATPRKLTEKVYATTPAHLLAAAERNVLAHLIDLTERRIIEQMTSSTVEHMFRLP